jgi:hypothetical protein
VAGVASVTALSISSYMRARVEDYKGGACHGCHGCHRGKDVHRTTTIDGDHQALIELHTAIKRHENSEMTMQPYMSRTDQNLCDIVTNGLTDDWGEK